MQIHTLSVSRPARLRRVAVFAVVLTALLLAAPTVAAAQAPPSFHVVILPGLPGAESVFPTAMNAAGTLAGNAAVEPFDPLATPVLGSVRRPTLPLAKPTDSLNFALGIGSNTLVVGSSSNFPYAWQSGTPIPLQPAAGLVQGAAHGVSPSGVICGTLFNDFSGQQLPVLWAGTGASGVGLPLGGGSGGAALAINAAGQVAGAVLGGGFAFQGARWDGATQAPVLVGVLPGAVNSELRAINAAGDTAGRSSFPDLSTHAVMHVQATGTLLDLGVLGGTFSEAFGINAAQSVVGTSSSASGTARAFLWSQGVLHDLNDLVASTSGPLLALSSAVAIDDGGRIAAQAEVPTPAGRVSRMAVLLPLAPAGASGGGAH